MWLPARARPRRACVRAPPTPTAATWRRGPRWIACRRRAWRPRRRSASGPAWARSGCWAVQPAVMALRRWARRADITCDRAGALCTRDLQVTTRALVKLALGSRRLYSDVNVDEYLRNLARPPGPAPVDEVTGELAGEQP